MTRRPPRSTGRHHFHEDFATAVFKPLKLNRTATEIFALVNLSSWVTSSASFSMMGPPGYSSPPLCNLVECLARGLVRVRETTCKVPGSGTKNKLV